MFVLATAFLVAITAELAVTSEAGAQERYWPPGEWRTASPESQGIDSDGLAAALEFIDSEALDIHSLQILRNGYLVLDAFFYPYSGRTRHDVASVTRPRSLPDRCASGQRAAAGER